jgi:hypothetical protein
MQPGPNDASRVRSPFPRGVSTIVMLTTVPEAGALSESVVGMRLAEDGDQDRFRNEALSG